MKALKLQIQCPDGHTEPELLRSKAALQAEFSKLKGGYGQFTGVKVNAASPSWPGLSGGQQGGKAKGKGVLNEEKRARTIYFGNFEDDTKGKTIKQFIETWTQDFKDKIEEVCPIGRVGEQGAARFIGNVGILGGELGEVGVQGREQGCICGRRFHPW